MVVVTDPDSIEFVIRKAMNNGGKGPNLDIVDQVSNDNHLPHSIATQEVEKWKKTRPLVNVLLHPSLINNLSPRISSIAQEWVMKIQELGRKQGDGSWVLPNMKSALNLYTMENIIALSLGKRFGLTTPKKQVPEDAQQYINDVEEMVARISSALLSSNTLYKYVKTPSYRKLEQATKSAMNYARRIRQGQMITPLETLDDGLQNLATVYTDLAKKNGLSEDDILAVDIGVVVSGVDTTSAMCMVVLYELAINPSLQEELYQELCTVMNVKSGPLPPIQPHQLKQLTTLKNFVKDAIRKSPSAALNMRKLFEDVEIQGYHIPKNTEIILNNFGVNRDEKYFENPLQVDPHRFDKETKVNEYSMLMFGLGERACPGKRVAMAEVYMLVANVVYEYHLQCDAKDYELKGPGLLVPQVNETNQIKFVSRESK